ncbi:MAG: asparaginase [Chloroflexi bacterium]|nr:asparaginase [Chloroflexota bacterium]
MSRVAVIFTGGTISMRHDPVLGGNVPSLDGTAILEQTPGLASIAEVVPLDMGRTPASHFTFDQLFEIGSAIRRAQLDRAIDGVVVVQGTDVLEETAFFWDLLLDAATPVVVTGAMRSASESGYEGPENLRNAVRAAAGEEFRGAGVVVCMAGTIHAADDVTKTHATALDTFQSLNDGPLATIGESGLTRLRARGARRFVRSDRADPRVRLVTAHVAMDGSMIGAVAAAGISGLVVEATGSGNTSASLLEAARILIEDGTPVVLATRCAAGATGTGYAFPGGGATWVRAGAMLPGTLSGPKARIALALGIGAGLNRPALSQLLLGPGGRG